MEVYSVNRIIVVNVPEVEIELRAYNSLLIPCHLRQDDSRIKRTFQTTIFHHACVLPAGDSDIYSAFTIKMFTLSFQQKDVFCHSVNV